MIIGLIPSRIGSSRLYQKALLEIDNLPLVIHTMKRAQLSKKINRVIVCTDSVKIYNVVKRHGGDVIMTSKSHKNGTERIAEVAKRFKNLRLVVDIQGDEPLIDPKNIDDIINFHLKNKKFDIVIPSAKFINNVESKNIVKIVSFNNKILYLSRSLIPHPFKEKPKFYQKHLSIISFKPEALNNYSKLKETYLEKIENIELLRALENNFKLGTFLIKSKSFSVDIRDDYLKAVHVMKKDKIRKRY